MPPDSPPAQTASPADTLFASPIGSISGFTFDAEVARVFPDMLKRSIPGYSTIIAQSGLLAQRFAQPDSTCYDLGCSLGATALAMHNNIKAPGCKVVAVDTSEAMLEGFADALEKQYGQAPADIELRREDIATTTVENASIVAMNFTLQFVAPGQRQMILDRLYEGMLDGGVLILSEKVVFADAQLNNLNIDMYHAFKSANGYSQLEISQKRTALEKVLIPDTLEQHQQRLSAAGFKSCSVWFQCFNFASLIALK